MKRNTVQWSLATGVVAAVLNVVVGLGWSSLTAENASWILAAINAVAAVVVAVKVRPFPVAVLAYAISVGASLLGSYGFHFSESKVTALAALAVAIAGAWTHGNVTPASNVKAGVVAPDGVTVLKPTG
jgi:hypothetical protein